MGREGEEKVEKEERGRDRARFKEGPGGPGPIHPPTEDLPPNGS